MLRSRGDIIKSDQGGCDTYEVRKRDSKLAALLLHTYALLLTTRDVVFCQPKLKDEGRDLWAYRDTLL